MYLWLEVSCIFAKIKYIAAFIQYIRVFYLVFNILLDAVIVEVP